VIHAHKDMVVAARHYAVGILGIGEDDVCFSAAKLFFAYGLGNAMYFPLWVGAQAVLFPGPPTPQGMFDTIAAYRPSIYYAVPTLYAAQLRVLAQADPKPDTSSVRVAVSAGEPLPAELYRRWTELTGIPLLDGIGTTESAHIFISNRLDAAKPGTSGKLVPGYEARIVDDGGNDVPGGETGNLVIKGGSVLSQYWNNPERNKAAFMDGWFRTGDTYYTDADGYYVCCGRSDDMLKVGGIWCSPVEIEAKLIEHPKILEAAVVGRPDADGLIKPEAFVVLNEADDASDQLAAELFEHCKNGLARYKYPRWFNFVGDLPKTATGKIQRFKLRAPAPVTAAKAGGRSLEK
jgi:benzoate-CoA ligase family protein